MTSLNPRLEILFTAVLVLAALAVAAVLVRREFVGRNASQPELEYMTDWPELLPAGRRFGDSTAPVKLVEFADLQCPYCRSFNRTLRETRAKYGSKLEFVFVHFPLPGHRLAIPAARAAECAHSQGRFLEFADQVYLMQDSLMRLEGSGEVKPATWTGVAWTAGVQDTAGFLRCFGDPAIPALMDKGVKAARRFAVHATPTIIINGWRFSVPPSESELHKRIDRLLAGKPPVSFLSRLF